MESFPDLYRGTDVALNVIKARYLKRDETGELTEAPKDMFERVARFIGGAEAKYGDDPGKVILPWYEMMARGDWEPNTPCLANAGHPGGLGQFSACFVLPVPDSMEGVFETLKNMALIHRSGGGTGFGFSELRPEGDYVRSTTGVASGPVSFMAGYNNTTEVVKQSGIRRGANMGILRVDHPDILQFIHCKRRACEVCAELGRKSCDHNIRNFNISVGITDAFMEALEADAEYGLINPRTKLVTSRLRARDVWKQIVENAWFSGEPGLFFVDRVNRLDPLSAYLGPIVATNPCVSGDTLILTRRGQLRIDSLVGQRVEVWNGQEWSEVEPRATGENQPMLRIEFSDGNVLRCTLRHGFHLADGSRVEARDLRVDDALEKLAHTPPVEGALELDYAYLAGFYQGDGFYNTEKGEQQINFYDEKLPIGDWLSRNGLVRLQPHSEAQNRQRGVLTASVPHKGVVPPNMTIESSLRWLAGLLDADGNIVRGSARSYGYQISSVNREFLSKVQSLLRQLGCPSVLSLMKNAERKTLPGGEYDCQPCWRLSVAASSAVRLLDMGLSTMRLSRMENKPAREALQFVRVKSIVEDGVDEKVYCFTEPKRHRGVFNNVLTAQCGEVPLRAYDACTLGSINLGNFYVEKSGKGTIDFERLRVIARRGVHFLDNVLTVNTYPIPEIADVTTKCRKIGLGVMGWADLLIRLGIPYASDRAISLAEEVSKFIGAAAVEMSEELAAKRGPFHYWDQSSWKARGDKPRRNSTVTVIAPTGSISIIAGCNFGIEPLSAVAMVRDQAGMKQLDVNRDFVAVAKREGWYTDAIMEQVTKTGSCRGVAGVPERVQELFAISGDIAPEWHVRMQAAFQKHTEDAVSKTINLPKTATIADVEAAYKMAWDLGCKGITVYRDGSRSKQVISVGSGSEPKAPPRRDLKSIQKIDGVRRRRGETLSVDTAYGSVHVTINEHPSDGQPFECFVELGKSGTETKALSESLGRAASLHLSAPSLDSPRKILEMVAEQFKGIGGGGQVGFGDNKVVSAPDGIAKAIRHYLSVDRGAGAEAVGGEVAHDICPECGQATLDKGVGCDLCSNCGYSSC